MEYCDTAEDYYNYKPWCTDHSEFATHVATDGDTPVCEVYAKRHGCNCGHYKDRNNESGPVKTLRALSEALEAENGYDTPELDARALMAVQAAVDRAIRELKEN